MSRHDANPRSELPGLAQAVRLARKTAKRKPTDADRPGVSTFPPQKAPPAIPGQLSLEDARDDSARS